MTDPKEEGATQGTDRTAVMSQEGRIRESAPSADASAQQTDRTVVMSQEGRIREAAPSADASAQQTDRTVVMPTIRREDDSRPSSSSGGAEARSDWVSGSSPQAQSRIFQFFAAEPGAKRDVVDEIEFGSRRIDLPRITLSGNSGGNLLDVSERFCFVRLLTQTPRDNVDLGRDLALERRLLIHSLRGEHLLDKRMRKAFVKEAELTAQLDHPAIVPVYNLNTDYRGGLHMTIKMINGMDFHSYIEEICVRYRLHGIQHYDESKSLIRRLSIFLRVCDAIEYAHSRGVIHGNLNPNSIMIGEFHAAYVQNWGQARFSGKSIPYDGSNPACLAPELLRGDLCDERTDVYSLGQLLYQTVTLRPAFAGDKPELIREAVLAGRMPPVEHRFHARIDADLRAIILRATQRRPESRYRSVSELSTDIRRYLNDERLSFQRSTFSGSFFRFLRHNRQKVILFSLLIVFSALFLFCYDLYREARHVHEGAVRDSVLDRCYSLCVQSGHLADLQAAKFKLTLQNLVAEAEAVLVHSFAAPDSGVLRTQADADGIPLQKTPGYAHPASLACMEFNRDCSMGAPVLSNEDFQKFSVLFHPVYRALLGSEFNATITPENVGELRRKALEGRLPLHEILIAFESGEFIRYPFQKKSTPANGAWLSRFALRDAARSANPVWSKPYATDDGDHRMHLTLPFGIGGRSLGTISLVFSCDAFELMARNSRRKGPGLLSKAILDEDGSILLNFPFDGEAKMECNVGRIENPELLKAFREQSSGQLILNENGREILYCFVRIPSCGHVYLERSDLNVGLRETLKEADRL